MEQINKIIAELEITSKGTVNKGLNIGARLFTSVASAAEKCSLIPGSLVWPTEV